jgi:hypothetical protein
MGSVGEVRPGLVLDDGRPRARLVVVDLDALAADGWSGTACRAGAGEILVGVGRAPLPAAATEHCSELALTLVDEDHEDPGAAWQVGVADVDRALATLSTAVALAPAAASTLVQLLRLTATLPVRDGLVAESLAYSMLMAGDEHRAWLAGRTRRPVPEAAEPVLLDRVDGSLTITVNRPERHNAFGRQVRDGLAEAFDLVALDDTITDVRLLGAGPSFGSGGDLDEFGLTTDVTTAHLIRVDRSVAARIDAVRERVRVELHGACIGAGIELASFAGHVTAAPDSRIVLPELAMGLVPGAGGTVGITRRIGRWRTAWLALSGEALPLPAARRWGLVDELAR